MPELPEVQTTVNGLQKTILGLTITNVWTNYFSPHFNGTKTVKDSSYFIQFKHEVIGAHVVSATRRAKNILIHIERIKNTTDTKDSDLLKTILIHMKMTGHLLYGSYIFDRKNKKDPWQPQGPESLKDPFNRHVRFVLSFSNNRHLVLSDVRKFAKITLLDTHTMNDSVHLKHIGPEPLEKDFTLDVFIYRLNLKRNSKVKQVLMDQRVIAGIGNIYADESLWHAGIHPSQKICDIPNKKIPILFESIKHTLSKGIDFGGDSTSDYRNIHGKRGKFHETHHAYQQTGTKCDKKKCDGIITRFMLGGRSTHYCDVHQKLI